MKFKDKQVLITGASVGIGAATALEVARRGGHVILVARRGSELERVADRIESSGVARPLSVVADITAAGDREKIRAALENGPGSLDVLINNAGITAHGRFDQADPVIVRRAMELNFFAAVELTALLLPLMKRESPGAGAAGNGGERQIVLVSTPSGLHGVPGRFAYSASKAAGHAWLETLRMELKSNGIHTLLFCPGYTRTELRTSGLAADGSRLVEKQASGALEPEAVARILCRGMERERRIVFTGISGRMVYWLRTLAPGLLEWLMSQKLKEDFAPKD